MLSFNQVEKSPLHLACESNQSEAIELLVAANANPNIVSSQLFTPKLFLLNPCLLGSIYTPSLGMQRGTLKSCKPPFK